MLISQGLSALIWCTLALATTSPQDLVSSSPQVQPQLNIADSQVRHGDFIGQQGGEVGIRSKGLPSWRRRKSRQSRSEQSRMSTRLVARQEGVCSDSLVCPDGSGTFQCCGEGFRCCVEEDGSGACCPIEQEVPEVQEVGGCVGEGCSEAGATAKAGAAPTVVLTTTVVRTVTVGSITQTVVVPITVSQTLTFLDPALRTQTNTVTITSEVFARSQVRRQEASIPQTEVRNSTITAEAVQPTTLTSAIASISGVATTKPAVLASESGVSHDVLKTVTVTTTVEVVTTVTGIATVTSTILNTVFVTLTLAPSATTTVFVTTTVRPRPEITGGQLPGGFIPPTGNEGLLPPNPPLLPSGSSPSNSLAPPGAGQNPTITAGTPLPPGVTGVLPPGNPQSMMPTAENPSASPTAPVRPIPGSSLTSDEIAGIALGIIFGLFFLILAGFLVYRLIKKKEALEITRHHQEMASSGSGSIPVGAASILSDSTQNRLIRPMPAAVLASDGTTSTTPGEGEVRIVIRPAPRRRTQSSGLLPPSGQGSRAASGSSSTGVPVVAEGSRRAQFPRPPGYSGQTYSFFVEESGSTSPMDPNAWSLASDHGSRNEQQNSPTDKWSPTSPRTYDVVSRDFGKSSGSGGGDFLSVGRALSPWKPV